MLNTHARFSRIFESDRERPSELGEIVSAPPQWQEVSVRIGYRNTVGSVVGYSIYCSTAGRDTGDK